jgi:hypothetical protein
MLHKIYVFLRFSIYVFFVHLSPFRGQHTVWCRSEWQHSQELTEFTAGFEPGTAA